MKQLLEAKDSEHEIVLVRRFGFWWWRLASFTDVCIPGWGYQLPRRSQNLAAEAAHDRWRRYLTRHAER